HDLGHAIAAVRIAAALNGLHARLVPEWSHADIAAITGIDRDEDYSEAEREEPGCILELTPVLAAVRLPHAAFRDLQATAWSGRASQLSEDHVQWPFMTDGATAPGVSSLDGGPVDGMWNRVAAGGGFSAAAAGHAYPANVILQRRSAVALDGVSSIAADR